MVKRLVIIKIGTASLTKKGKLDLQEIKRFIQQVVKIKNAGNKVILVTSGAIASGISELGVKSNPNDIVFKQACAATGQSILMYHYRSFFKEYGIKVAQILLTEENLSSRASYLNICNVLDRLLKLGVVPIINENDVTSINEIIPVMRGYQINFSDNDILSVLVANAVEADLIIILSTVDGLFTKNPKDPDAKMIPYVEKITTKLKKFSFGKNKWGRGGIKTKLEAAEIAMKSGIPLVIANSRRKDIILDILKGDFVGTYFQPSQTKMSSIERWIAYGAGSKGQIKVNKGAKEAIQKGASLLAVGVEKIIGQFQIGDVISLMDQDGKEFARGISNYTSEEITLIKGVKTGKIREILGYIRQKEVVLRKRICLL